MAFVLKMNKISSNEIIIYIRSRSDQPVADGKFLDMTQKQNSQNLEVNKIENIQYFFFQHMREELKNKSHEFHILVYVFFFSLVKFMYAAHVKLTNES